MLSCTAHATCKVFSLHCLNFRSNLKTQKCKGWGEPCSRHKRHDLGACAYVILRAELEHSGGFELGNLADRPGKVRLHRGPGRLQRSGRAPHASQHGDARRDGEGAGSENAGTRHRSEAGTTEGLWVRTGKGNQQGSKPKPEPKAGDHRLRSYTCAFFLSPALMFSL